MYCDAARGNKHKKFCEDWACCFGDRLADKQTSLIHHNAPLPYRIWSENDKKNQEKHIQQIVEWQKFIDKMLLAIFKIIKN